MALFGPMRGLSSFTSCSMRCSASGSLVKVLLQNQLGGHRIHFLVLDSLQAAFRLHRRVALVDPRHRLLELSFQPAREIFRLPRHRMRLALRGSGKTHDQGPGLPLRDQRLDLLETRDGRQRVRGAQFWLADCYTNTLETKIEGKNGSIGSRGALGPLKHASPRPAAARNRGRGAPSPWAGAPPP